LEEAITNLADNLTVTAGRHGDRPALRLSDDVVTYSELQDRAQRVATMLTERGVGPGDRVGLVLPNVLEFPVLFYGALSVGEIAIKGEPVMKGCWGRPESTQETICDGWFHSGDLAEQYEDCYYTIVDRKKDLIIRGGYNVYPREVEEALYEHEAVAEAAVIGIANDDLGEEIGAAVALKPGSSVDGQDLRSFAKEQVAAYKCPRNVWIVDELPKGPTSKILSREITAPEEV
jgi:acyl-CoA synthetase (AMP-forming)/AMP-acid ligase II